MKCYALTVIAYTLMKNNIGGIDMLPDEMEAEKNRKMILSQADEIEILKRNVRDLQGQLNSAQIHNKNLTQSLANAYADISRLAEEANANTTG